MQKYTKHVQTDAQKRSKRYAQIMQRNTFKKMGKDKK